MEITVEAEIKGDEKCALFFDKVKRDPEKETPGSSM